MTNCAYTMYQYYIKHRRLGIGALIRFKRDRTCLTLATATSYKVVQIAEASVLSLCSSMRTRFNSM